MSLGNKNPTTLGDRTLSNIIVLLGSLQVLSHDDMNSSLQYDSDSESDTDFFASDLNWSTIPHAMASNTAGGSGFTPITPPISEADHTALAEHTGTSDDSSDSTRSKRKRSFVPDDRKDNKYWERRKKNNIAAKKSRETRRKRQDEELQRAETAIQENNKLKAEIEVLKNEVSSLRRLLRDANMTLALWIKARQSNENPLQMSPVLPKPDHAYSFMPYSRAPDNP